MSWDYGWNAQSALLPQKTVQIKVGEKGNQKIKAAMLLSKQKMKNLSQIKGAYSSKQIKQQIPRNKGIEQRMKRDQQAGQLKNINNEKSLSLIKHQLQKKQKIYEQIQKKGKNHSLFLVDFVEKQLSKQDEQLQHLKKQFYAGKLKQIMKQQQRIHQSDGKQIHEYMRQNLAWQKQVLQELNGQLVEQKLRVSQSFDRRLSQQQKIELSKIIQQRLRMKLKIIELNKQRQQQKQQRLIKIRKLDILQSSQDQQQQQKKQQINKNQKR